MNESTSAKSPRFEKSSSKRTILRFGSQSDDDIGDLLATTSPTTSVLDLERELMKRRDKLLSSLQDRALQKEFMRFMSNSKSPGFFLMLHLLSCFSVIQTVFKFRYGQQRFILLWCAAEFALEIVVVVSGWLLYGSINDEESYWGSYTSWLLKGSKPRLREKNADLLQAIYYMACVAVRSLDLIQRTVAGQCPSTDIPHSFSCNNSAHAGSFPMESFFILLLVPVLFVCVLKETRMYLNITAGVVAVFSISLCALLLASGRAVCGQVEDEIITSEPENYQPPLSAMQRQQSQAHLSRKSLSSRFSIRSSQLSVAGSQWLREATSSNSNGIDAMLASMGTRRSILKTSKVAPLGSSVSTVRQVESTQTIRTVHHLEIPSDIEAQDDVEEEEEHHHTHRHRRRQRRPIPHRRMSNASNVSQ
eukprot:gene16215-18353_t